MGGCSKYSAGMLKHRVTFQKALETDDGAGGVTQSWRTINAAPRRAMMVPKAGREVHEHGRLESRPRVFCVTRYSEAFVEANRVLFDGRAYNIRDIRNVDFANRWLEIDLDGGVAV